MEYKKQNRLLQFHGSIKTSKLSCLYALLHYPCINLVFLLKWAHKFLLSLIFLIWFQKQNIVVCLKSLLIDLVWIVFNISKFLLKLNKVINFFLENHNAFSLHHTFACSFVMGHLRVLVRYSHPHLHFLLHCSYLL